MLETVHIFILVVLASFIGSLNGLGVTFIITLFLLIVDSSNHHSHSWIPYISTFIVSLIFILTRVKIVFRNIVPILYLGFFSAVGLLIGKIFKENLNLLWIKMFFGALIIYFTWFLNRIQYFSRLNISFLSKDVWSFSTTDNFIILIIGFSGGLLDFSLAVMIYTYLVYNKEEYNVEHLDVCVYSTLTVTSFVNFIYIMFYREVSYPEYFNFSYILALMAGSIAARSVYNLITLEYKRKFIIFALYSLGFKLLFLNFLIERFSR